jgi:hypothetical protein
VELDDRQPDSLARRGFGRTQVANLQREVGLQQGSLDAPRIVPAARILDVAR